MIQYIHQECIKSELGYVYVATGAYHDAISNEIPEAHLIYNANWTDGMASTISFAMKNINQEILDGVIIILSDQVFLTSDTLNRLAQKATNETNQIVNCKYQKGLGPPTYFHKSLFSELEKLSGDEGAKSIVKKYSTSLTSINFPKGDIDLDTTIDIKILDEL